MPLLTVRRTVSPQTTAAAVAWSSLQRRDHTISKIRPSRAQPAWRRTFWPGAFFRKKLCRVSLACPSNFLIIAPTSTKRFFLKLKLCRLWPRLELGTPAWSLIDTQWSIETKKVFAKDWTNPRSFGFNLFSLQSSALDHFATVPPWRLKN